MRKKLIWVTLTLLLLTLLAGTASAQVQNIKFKRGAAALRVGGTAQIQYKVLPASEKDTLDWASSDAKVATVSQNGRVTAHAPGKAVITASSGGASAKLRLTVKSAAITRVVLDRKRASAPVGTLQLTATVSPATASASLLRWKSSNAAVATVNASGLVTLNKPGRVQIAAISPTGKKAVCTITVTGESARGTRRALVIGEGRPTRQLAALPMVPSEVAEVADMLTKNGVSTSTLVNSTRAKVLSAIERTFSAATERDISYVYITCHGGIDARNVYNIYLSGDGAVTAAQLRQALEGIPGRVVVMLGACQSGSVISKGAPVQDGAALFLRQFMGPASKAGELKDGKFVVLCACKGSEKGYGVITKSNATGQIIPSGTYNFFGRSVAEAGKNGDADQNGDGRITLNEMYLRVKARVSALHDLWREELKLTSEDVQTVVAYPNNSSFVLFE